MVLLKSACDRPAAHQEYPERVASPARSSAIVQAHPQEARVKQARQGLRIAARNSPAGKRRRAGMCVSWMKPRSSSSGCRSAARHDFEPGGLRLIVRHRGGEALAQHAHRARFLQPPDDVWRKLARAVSLLTLLEDCEHQWRQ